MRLLTPTENRRLNEMVGFLGITLAMLMALALLSYSPHDSSFNVASQAPESHPALNWIGPTGAYGADMLFQAFGYAAFPAAHGHLRARPAMVSQPSAGFGGRDAGGLRDDGRFRCLPCWRCGGLPDVRGAIPPGGLLGTLLADGLHAAFNSVGAHVVAVAIFLTALFLTTSFSFTGTHALLRGPLKKLDPIGRLKSRWAALARSARASASCAKRWRSIRRPGANPCRHKRFAAQIAGKPPAR